MLACSKVCFFSNLQQNDKIAKTFFFSKKAQPVACIGLFRLNPGFVKRPNLAGSGIFLMVFQLLE